MIKAVTWSWESAHPYPQSDGYALSSIAVPRKKSVGGGNPESSRGEIRGDFQLGDPLHPNDTRDTFNT